MSLDPHICRRAHEMRDPRFDGRFFIGVTTTGIYCRPICPARTPKPENVAYWPSAAAAQNAGFRPCLRCRPECAPGAPAGLGTMAAAARALRLIDEGALDEGSVETLAGRVGMSDRHLRRLFQEHFGASPAHVAQTRRALLAKSLIERSTLKMSEISLAAGYRSLTRFNCAIKDAYHRAPTQLRRAAGQTQTGSIRLSFAARPPFDADAMLHFYGARAIPGVGAVRERSYHIATRAGGAPARVALTFAHDGVEVEVALEALAALPALIARVRRALDIDCDPTEIADALANDAVLKRAFAAIGPVRLLGHLDPFETVIRAILGQQVSIAAARTLAGRMCARWGAGLPSGLATNAITHLFPTPDALAQAPVEEIGLTRARAHSVRTMAQAVAQNPALLDPPGDVDGWTTELSALPGIGPWTAHYAALRAFCEPDAFPAGDLIVRRAYAALAKEAMASPKALEARAQAWRPLRGYAAQALWSFAARFPERLKVAA